MALYISLFNIILAFSVFINHWRVNRNTIYLSLLMFLIATFSVTHYLVIEGNSAFWLAVTVNNFTPFWCLIGPFLFLYVRSVLTDRMTIKWWDILHTVPFWITLLGALPYIVSPFSYKLFVAHRIIEDMNAIKNVRMNWLVPQEVNLLVRPFLQIGYAVACLIIIARFHVRHLPVRQGQRKRFLFIIRWLYAVSGFILLIGIYYLLALIFNYRYPELGRTLIYEFQTIYLTGISLIFLPVLLFVFPQILWGIPQIRLSLSSVTVKEKKIATVTPSSDSKVDSLLTAPVEGKTEDKSEERDPFDELAEQILRVMEEKKPFLNVNFSMDVLAELLDVPKHHLFYCFRHHLNKKFTRLRTEFRIRHAKTLLEKVNLRETTLEAIGMNAGFPSRSTFYQAFKDEMGITPGEYLEGLKKEKINP